MARSKEKVFDDIARMAGGAVSLMSGLTRQVQEEIRARVDELAARMDLVPREDFERLEAVLSETRRKVDALERKLESGSKSGSGKTSKKKSSEKGGRKKKS